MKKKVIFSIIILGIILLFTYFNHSLNKTPKIGYGNKSIKNISINKSKQLFIQVIYSDCIPTKTIEDMRRLLSQNYSYTMNNNNSLEIEFYYLSYKNQTSTYYTFNITDMQFYGPTLKVYLYEKTNESMGPSIRYAKCVRKVSVKIYNPPKNLSYIVIEPYRFWKGKIYWGGKTIEIPIKQ